MLRVPYDIKDQEASVGFIEPALEEEKKAMLRNGNIHHRTETYRGLSDLMLLATYDKQALFRAGDSLKISAGTTLPTGKTEENPFELGDKGREHLHIQFGTGTFDPLLEANYGIPLARKFRLGGWPSLRLLDGKLAWMESCLSYSRRISIVRVTISNNISPRSCNA